MVLVLRFPLPTSQSPSPNTAPWMSPLSTIPVSSGWPSLSQLQLTFLLSNRLATSRGRSTWSCCPPRSNVLRPAFRRARVPSSQKHLSFPGWSRRPWETMLFASACTASDGWKKRRSWERRCSTWRSSTCRAKLLYLSPWSLALNLQWEHFLNILYISNISCTPFLLYLSVSSAFLHLQVIGEAVILFFIWAVIKKQLWASRT